MLNIDKVRLLTKQGLQRIEDLRIKDTKKVVKQIESCILAAADNGENSIKYEYLDNIYNSDIIKYFRDSKFCVICTNEYAIISWK